jgi:pSer/pThr/pTyr-binding forkhead associated (FHA) protein
MFRESGERRDFPLPRSSVVIGRQEDCSIRIPLPEVSRRHVSIDISGPDVVVKDLGSANGTYVNNNRVTEDTLAAGDHLIIGPVVFTVQIDGEPEDIRPVKTQLRRRASARADQPTEAKVSESDSVADLFGLDAEDEDDPISALEALASSADQTAVDPYEDDEEK